MSGDKVFGGDVGLGDVAKPHGLSVGQSSLQHSRMDLVIPGGLVILVGNEVVDGEEDSLKRTVLVPDIALGPLIVEKVVIGQAEESASDRGLDVGLQYTLVAGKWRRKREVDLDHTGYDGCASAVHGQAAVQIKSRLAQH